MSRLFIYILLGVSLYASAISLPDNFQSKFTQTITNTKKKVINYEGEVSFSDKNLFKWSYQKPTKKETCTNGDALLVVDHDLEQVSRYTIAKSLDIGKVLKSAKHYKDNIYVAEYENKKYTIQFDNQKRLQSIAFYDDLDNKVQVLFIDMKYGKGKLPSKKMQCNYPKDYDMIQG